MNPGVMAALAGLWGAGGIALGAIAAHRVPDPALATAANYLVIHAAAVVAVGQGASAQARANLWLAAAACLLAGSGLFAADMVSRAFFGSKLFPMAAPIGGSTMILGWLTIAAAGVMAWRTR